MTRTFPLLAAAATTLSFAGLAAGQVVFSDSFDRVAGNSDDSDAIPNDSDFGQNDNALGGSIVQTYTFDESRGGGAQQTVNGSEAVLRAGAVQIEFDFASLPELAGGYTVAFDFTRTMGNGFVALGIGLDDTDQIEDVGGFNGNAALFDNPGMSVNGAEGAVLFRQDNTSESAGAVELFNQGDVVATQDGFFADRESTQSALVTVLAPDGYGAGSVGTLTAEIGGNSISTDITFDGVSSGFLSLYSNQVGLTLDNLAVSAIPEPASLSLLGAGGLALLARRRR